MSVSTRSYTTLPAQEQYLSYWGSQQNPTQTADQAFQSLVSGYLSSMATQSQAALFAVALAQYQIVPVQNRQTVTAKLGLSWIDTLDLPHQLLVLQQFGIPSFTPLSDADQQAVYTALEM